MENTISSKEIPRHMWSRHAWDPWVLEAYPINTLITLRDPSWHRYSDDRDQFFTALVVDHKVSEGPPYECYIVILDTRRDKSGMISMFSAGLAADYDKKFIEFNP